MGSFCIEHAHHGALVGAIPFGRQLGTLKKKNRNSWAPEPNQISLLRRSCCPSSRSPGAVVVPGVDAAAAAAGDAVDRGAERGVSAVLAAVCCWGLSLVVQREGYHGRSW